jgi:hypothetical protein
MAYEIRIIGEPNPIVLPNDKGLKVIAMYESAAIAKDTKVNLGDLMRTTKGQIRSIKKVDDSAAGDKKSNKYVTNVDEEHLKIYKEWVIRTPEQKANRTAMFAQVYKTIHDKDPEPEVIEALKKDLIIFFTENKKRTYGDPAIYIKHFGEGIRNKKISKFKSVILNLMERVLSEDMTQARRN